jgi:hypothetical protein
MEFDLKNHSDAQDLLFLFASRLRAALTYRQQSIGLDGYTSALFMYRLMKDMVRQHCERGDGQRADIVLEHHHKDHCDLSLAYLACHYSSPACRWILGILRR